MHTDANWTVESWQDILTPPMDGLSQAGFADGNTVVTRETFDGCKSPVEQFNPQIIVLG